jgi:hypothetical protein
VPEVVDQPIARDDLAGVEHEDREQGALLAASQPKRSTVVDDLERTEDAELHGSMVRVLQGTCNRRATSPRDPRPAMEYWRPEMQFRDLGRRLTQQRISPNPA